jgi:protein-tyrosine phosphatase
MKRMDGDELPGRGSKQEKQGDEQSCPGATGGCVAAVKVDTPIPGALNFRAVQPFPARDGARLVQGYLWRSGTFEGVGVSGLQAIRAFGITSAFDLRSAREIDAHPAPFGPSDGIAIAAPRHSARLGDLFNVIRHADTRPEDIRQAMIRVYRDMPGRFAYVLSPALAHAAAATSPFVINCTAGKDRTGVAVALILSALGVSRDDIFEDYLTSNRAAEDLHRMLKGRRSGGLDYASLPDALLTPLHAAYADYLAAFFDEVDAQTGGMEAFLTDQLKLDRQRRDQLARHLLQG